MSSQEVIYGWHAVKAVLNSSQRIFKIYMLESLDDEAKKSELQQLAEKQQLVIHFLDRAAMNEIANTEKHQGIIVVCQKKEELHEKDIGIILDRLVEPALILILDQIQDPHNLGAILRTADAAGVDLVIAPKDRAASVNATVRKVASGAAEVVSFITVTNLARVMRELKERGIWIYGLAGESKELLYQQNFTHATAIVMGAEGKGLRQNTKTQCDILLSIPMQGNVSSLNVSVATGVALYEVVRQRYKI